MVPDNTFEWYSGAADVQQEEEVNPAMEIELEELQQDMRNAALLHVVSVGLKELQQQFDSRSHAVGRPRTPGD